MLQREALDILKLGKNVFLTGPAGSGKTHIVNAYVDYLKSHAVDVAVTASTGIAATHIGGQTIHSWSGLGVRDTLTDRDIDDMMGKQYLYKRFEQTKVLIIDEVSMLHHFRLDMVEWICRVMKRSDKPFGGMQVILVGDFFQLPPVSRGQQIQANSELVSEFAYRAESWQRAGLAVCYLSEQHRQKDNTYLGILNQIREDSVSERTIELLKSRFNREPENAESWTKLFTHNIDVDIINNRHLSLIKAKERVFNMSSRGASGLVETLKRSCLSPEKLVLKVGARVMCTKNSPEGGYVNGTLGIVEDFDSYGDPVIKTNSGRTIAISSQSWKIEEDGKVKAEIIQVPLRLAWAITVHKSQGMSLDAVEMDLSKSFVRGMGYVALSRVRSLGSVKLLGFNDMSLEVDPEVLQVDREFRDLSQTTRRNLAKISPKELERKQKEFLESIEPEEKIKIKKKEKLLKKSTQEITADLLLEELSLSDVANRRKLQPETIVSHIEDLIAEKKSPHFLYLQKEFKGKELDTIISAFQKARTTTLSPVYNILARENKKQSFLKIRLARLFLHER